MLVLTRQPGEEIIIGDNIIIKITQVRGDRVSVGVLAPTEISVHRKEVWEKVQQAKRNG